MFSFNDPSLVKGKSLLSSAMRGAGRRELEPVGSRGGVSGAVIQAAGLLVWETPQSCHCRHTLLALPWLFAGGQKVGESRNTAPISPCFPESRRSTTQMRLTCQNKERGLPHGTAALGLLL